jgi:hypothetical protein
MISAWTLVVDSYIRENNDGSITYPRCPSCDLYDDGSLCHIVKGNKIHPTLWLFEDFVSLFH